MKQLRFVTLSEDAATLVLESVDGDERFTMPVDAVLRAAVRTELPRLPEPVAAMSIDAPAEPAITPREIQVRVRAGESAEAIASTYGMPLERVMRFAAPVMDERQRITDEARRARARRTGAEGTEPKQVFLGEAVDERFRAHGIDPDAVRWDARRRDDGEWLVIAEWLGGEATHTAEWLFSRTSRSVVPLDETATDLLSDKPIRPVAPAPRPSLAAAPRLAPGVVAFPPMPDAYTGPVPKVEDVFDQDALAAQHDEPAAGLHAAPDYPPASFDEPPLPLGIAEPAQHIRNLGAGRREESDEERAARARVPSWDDILLGIKRRD